MKSFFFESSIASLSVVIALSVSVVSCTPSKKESSAPPAAAKSAVETGSVQPAEYGLELMPDDPNRNSVLTLAPKGFFLSESKITWLVNGAIDPDSSGEQFQAARAARGDTIQAKAVFAGGEVLSNSVTIRNTPPSVTDVKFIPDVFKPGDKLGVSATGTDPDGDEVTLAYEWTVNGEPAGSEKILDRDLKRGDTVEVKITPFDGQEYGTVSVVQRKIENMPPVITEHKDFNFDGSVYSYQVKASDPDGDPLEYELESPAEGMTINRSTGLFTWRVPETFKGKKRVSVVVRDGHGGAASYSFDISIGE